MSTHGTSTTGAPSTVKTNYDADAPPALIEFMSGGWIDRPLAAAVHPQLARLRERREALSAAYRGRYLSFAAGSEHVRANDTYFRFRPSSDFAYLMGGGEPGAVLLVEPHGDKHRTVLFAREHNRGTEAFFTDRVAGELWVGRHRGVDESQLFFGVDACRPLGTFPAYLEELRGSGARISDVTQDSELATRLAEMRLIKDAYELEELRKACAITKRGFEDAIRAMRPGGSEREIEAAFWSRARIEANDVGYLTIAAAGEHACTLHWNRNDGTLRDDALLLLDAGVECDSLYTADVTRTLPVGGRFSPEQRAVYEIVWEAQRAGIAAVAPGNDFLEPNRAAMRALAQGLIDLGILSSSLDEALDPQRPLYRRYTLHNVSHMLGLDVHDCAKARMETYKYGKLVPGMVLTVEPGIYLQPDDLTVPQRYRGIGVRIEDDVLITADGYRNLSDGLPRDPDAIERWMAALWA
ncbi:MAG TPA: aminopeptidase P family protein [Candidatus Acidoferrales bacterium]|nr:aminopeptidase P family protein [Candidatus Acidoferrales bacterium]